MCWICCWMEKNRDPVKQRTFDFILFFVILFQHEEHKKKNYIISKKQNNTKCNMKRLAAIISKTLLFFVNFFYICILWFYCYFRWYFYNTLNRKGGVDVCVIDYSFCNYCMYTRWICNVNRVAVYCLLLISPKARCDLRLWFFEIF